MFYIQISDVEKKITDSSNLVSTTALNTKISEVESKIPNHINLLPLLSLIR